MVNVVKQNKNELFEVWRNVCVKYLCVCVCVDTFTFQLTSWIFNTLSTHILYSFTFSLSFDVLFVTKLMTHSLSHLQVCFQYFFCENQSLRRIFELSTSFSSHTSSLHLVYVFTSRDTLSNHTKTSLDEETSSCSSPYQQLY